MTTGVTPTADKSVLHTVERLSEILFGLIMVLTFTGSISIATADRAEVKTVLIGAIGCNIAWGLIDAIMYLMACLNHRGTEIETILAIRRSRGMHHVKAVVRDHVPQVVWEEMDEALLERIHARACAMPLRGTAPRLHRNDVRGALAVFLIVVTSTLPVILPFVYLDELTLAMRLSNGIAVTMLALIGYAYGRASGISPWLMAAAMVVLGTLLVALTIALGG